MKKEATKDWLDDDIEPPAEDDPIVKKEEVVVKKEDNKDEPILKKPERKPKKDKEESISDLRKAKDELKAKVDELQAALDGASKLGNESLKPIAEYIETKYGKIDEASIKAFIEHNKSRKTQLNELAEKMKDKDEKLKDLDIRASEEFEEQYVKPHKERISDLFAEVAMVDKNGEPIQPDLFNNVVKNIAKNAKDITSARAKAILKELGEKYKEITGEDYEPPTISSFMSAVREVKTVAEKMEHAYNNWETVKKESTVKSQAEKQREQEQASKQQFSERRKLAQKAVDEFNYDDFDGIVESDDIVEIITNEFKRGEKQIAGEEQPKSYDFYLARGAKAELFDKIMPEFKRLRELYKSDQDDDRDDPKIKAKRKQVKKDDDVDWLGQ